MAGQAILEWFWAPHRRNCWNKSWDNFIRGLKFLSTSIKDSTVLINAYGVLVAKEIGVTFLVTDAPIRKAGTGIKNSTAPKKNDYGLEVGEVVPKSIGIGIPTKQTRNNSCLKFRQFSFSLKNDPIFKIMLGTKHIFTVKESGLEGGHIPDTQTDQVLLLWLCMV